MKDSRLIYRVILKVFALTGAFIVLFVLLGSLFTHEEASDQNMKITAVVALNLKKMRAGEIKKRRWDGREVGVLKYFNSTNKMPQYLVYFNTGDSGNCPLFYTSGTFKDTCTGTLYDQTGHEKNTQHPKSLKSPPYHIKDSLLIIGK